MYWTVYPGLSDNMEDSMNSLCVCVHFRPHDRHCSKGPQKSGPTVATGVLSGITGYRTAVIERTFSSVQFSSVTQSCPTLYDPMNRSTPGLPVHHQLPEYTQTHVHRVSDAIQPSYPLSSPSPPAPNPSQHQSLFQRVNSSHQVAKVLEFQL